MAGPYFQKARWAPFMFQGAEYPLNHLDEYEFTVKDSDKQDRRIVVTFGDHCFTRNPEPGDDPALVYPTSDRRPGHFCFDRYHHTSGLVGHIRDVAQAGRGQVWTVDGNNFAIVPVVNHAGKANLYAIVFSLDRVKGLPVHLHMRIKTAHACTDKNIVTFGAVRFRHLVALRMKGKVPGRITSRDRKTPGIP
jgi:hypothetical protein